MASNRELSEAAQKLAAELGKDVPATDGLKNHELTKLVDDLTAERDAKNAGGETAGLSSSGDSHTSGGDPVREDGTVARVGEIDPMRVGGGEPAKPLEGEVHTYTNDPSLSERNGTAPKPAASAKPGEVGKSTRDKPDEPTYKIAPGHGVTTLRGLLGEGEAVQARDFHGGQANLDTLVESGTVLKS